MFCAFLNCLFRKRFEVLGNHSLRMLLTVTLVTKNEKSFPEAVFEVEKLPRESLS
jgi:hypothetical protein